MTASGVIKSSAGAVQETAKSIKMQEAEFVEKKVTFAKISTITTVENSETAYEKITLTLKYFKGLICSDVKHVNESGEIIATFGVSGYAILGGGIYARFNIIKVADELSKLNQKWGLYLAALKNLSI